MAPIYMVECFWPGVTETALLAAAENAAADRSARCLELILIPADEIVLCVFEAPSETAVSGASRRAGLSPDRIVESVRIRPPA